MTNLLTIKDHIKEDLEWIPAYAKINLILKVVGRRSLDGYHLLQMINVEVDLYDELVVSHQESVTAKITIDVIDDLPFGTPVEVIKDPQKSSLGKAWFLFCELFCQTGHVHVQLRKRIPVGAGLGGGTSDAAALINWCWRNLLSKEDRDNPENRNKLQELAIRVGADVPFSMVGGCALVTGIGEKITPLDYSLSGTPLIIIVPPVSIPTPSVFSMFRELNCPFSLELDPSHYSKVMTKYSEIAQHIKNDLQPIVQRGWSDVDNIIKSLTNEGSNQIAPQRCDQTNTAERDAIFTMDQIAVSMSGSGSAVFVIPKNIDKPELSGQLLLGFVQSRINSDALIIPTHIR